MVKVEGLCEAVITPADNDLFIHVTKIVAVVQHT